MVKTALSSAMGVGKSRKASELRRKLLGGPSALLVDPLGFDAGDSNLYRYVNNEPTSISDPTGQEPDFVESSVRRWLKGDRVVQEYKFKIPKAIATEGGVFI